MQPLKQKKICNITEIWKRIYYKMEIIDESRKCQWELEKKYPGKFFSEIMTRERDDGVGEMTQWLRTVTGTEEDWGTDFSNE